MKFRPKIDKYYYWIVIPTSLLLLVMTVFAFFEPISLLIMIPTDLLTLYFFISPLFGYVELREESLFIKYGFILKKDIPYGMIKGYKQGRGIMSYSMYSLKNSMEHVDIFYNKFDMTCISVMGVEEFLRLLEERISGVRK